MRYVTPILIIMSLAYAATASHIVSLATALGINALGCAALLFLAVQAQVLHRQMIRTTGRQK